jgi:hypothetical protein
MPQLALGIFNGSASPDYWLANDRYRDVTLLNKTQADCYFSGIGDILLKN